MRRGKEVMAVGRHGAGREPGGREHLTGAWPVRGGGILVLLFLVLASCSPKRVHEEPILRNGDRVVVPEPAAGPEADEERAERDSLFAAALGSCEPEVCAAVVRGEVALEMTEAQLMAATRTTPDAWSVRRSAEATVYVPASTMEVPGDVLGSLALVQLDEGRVASYAYREAQGVRLVQSPSDATLQGRAAALGEMLLREGDDLAARGDMAGALDRYDRADLLRPGDPMVDYRIATILDQRFRPLEALIRYRLFLHQMELEKIEAVGEAAGKVAEAVARAKERIIVLEKRGG